MPGTDPNSQVGTKMSFVWKSKFATSCNKQAPEAALVDWDGWVIG